MLNIILNDSYLFSLAIVCIVWNKLLHSVFINFIAAKEKLIILFFSIGLHKKFKL